MNSFFDTNVFVYSVSVAPEDAQKREMALSLIEKVQFQLSLQVVQEFIHTCLRKQRLGQDREALRRSVDFVLASPCHSATRATVRRAMDLQASYQLRYWDSAILAATQESCCTTLYSEDFNDDQDYGGVRVINPFRSAK